MYGKEATNTCMNLGCKKKKEKKEQAAGRSDTLPLATAEQVKGETKKKGGRGKIAGYYNNNSEGKQNERNA